MSKINEKVLVIDDDPAILAMYKKQFQGVVDIVTAQEPWIGLEILKRSGPFALLVTDYKLPSMDGLKVIEEANKFAPDTLKILLTGYANLELAMKAINEGRVFRFLTKPCSNKLMASSFIAAISHYRKVIAEKETLERTFNGCVQMLTDVISLSTPMAFNRARKMRNLARKLSSKLPIENKWDFENAALFSQLGFVTLPHLLLEKIQLNAEITPVEEQMLARVPESGEKLLKNIPRLENIANIVRYSEKNFDGSGYPDDDVSMYDLPVESRALKIISAICRLEENTDDFDIISAKIREGKGAFDPELTELILAELEISSISQVADEVEIMKLNIDELKIGDILLTDVETADGKLLFSLGNEVSQVILTKLLNYSEITKIKEPITIKRKL
ncbi:MAG: response regulator [Candidatus Rifleibacteriota bacterium]